MKSRTNHERTLEATRTRHSLTVGNEFEMESGTNQERNSSHSKETVSTRAHRWITRGGEFEMEIERNRGSNKRPIGRGRVHSDAPHVTVVANPRWKSRRNQGNHCSPVMQSIHDHTSLTNNNKLRTKSNSQTASESCRGLSSLALPPCRMRSCNSEILRRKGQKSKSQNWSRQT